MKEGRKREEGKEKEEKQEDFKQNKFSFFIILNEWHFDYSYDR